jgi:uncharacterized damage-inducible protein DinB
MSVLANDLANSLEREGAKTIEFFRALSPDQLNMQVYADGPGWTVHNLLAHFTDVEGMIPRLIRSILSGSEGVQAEFSIDEWNAEHTAEMSAQSSEALISEFANRRAATVAMVRAFTDANLETRGRHPALGVTEVKHMVKLMYIHLQGHQRDIKRVLKAVSS